MNYFIAAVCGLAIGAAGAYINYRITLAAIGKGTAKAITLSNFIHTLINIAILAFIFLLRDILPFDFMVCIVGAAVGLSLFTIIYSFKAASKAKEENKATESSEEPEPESENNQA